MLITRPSPDGEITTASLLKVGIDALHTPLMTIAFLPPPSPLPMQGVAALAFTSANGVRAWMNAHHGHPPPIPAFLVGPASATTADEHGLPIAGVAEGDVESLARLIAKKDPGPILHVQGIHAAGDLVGALEQQSITAMAVRLYEAVAAKALPINLHKALTGGPCTVALFSPRTAQLFKILVAEAKLTQSLKGATAACLSPNVAKVARTLPFHEINIAPALDHASFVDMVKAGCP
ncbi:MAG: uroporphyrinogen-III synthase [Pseudomonadota bacterium]